MRWLLYSSGAAIILVLMSWKHEADVNIGLKDLNSSKPDKALALKDDSLCRLVFSSLSVTIDRAVGARVISFKWNGQEFLTPSTVEKVYYGATLWPAPQSRWWPVDASLDNNSYRVLTKTDKLIHLISATGKSGLQVEKKFYIQPLDTALQIEYTIRNTSKEIKSVGPWELIRTKGGTTFFPVETHKPFSQSNLKNIHIDNGLLFYNFKKADIHNSSQKLFTHATKGWLAHITTRGMLFIKQYPDVKTNEVAPGQGEVEIFVNDKATYVELETHGVYHHLKPQETLHYKVLWYLRPSDIIKHSKQGEWSMAIENFLAAKKVSDNKMTP